MVLRNTLNFGVSCIRYARAQCCYAYLSDILGSCPVLGDGRIGDASSSQLTVIDQDDERNFWHQAFARSKWFTRGWTLQELLAPKVLKFFGSNWNYIGNPQLLKVTISKVTNIDSDILLGTRDISSANVAQKMAWAAGRKTSRVEDQAYSLLGLFGVNMPMLYGEGSKAFNRLQIEIMRLTTDQTILAWNGNGQDGNGRLLADSPADFLQIRKVVGWGRPGSFEMTNHGLRIYVPVLKRESAHGLESLAILNCRYEDDFSGVLALRLQSYNSWGGYHLFLENELETLEAKLDRLVFISTHELSTCRSEKLPIEITPTFEPEFPGVRLWLELSGPAEIAQASRSILGEKKRDLRYTASSAVASIPDSAADMGTIGARLRCFPDKTVFVAFGFDRRLQRKNVSKKYGQLWVWLSLPEKKNLLLELFALYDADGSKTHQFCYRKTQSKFQLDIGHMKVVQAEVALREILGEEVIVCTVRVAESASQQPVEICSASEEGSSAPREDTPISELSEQSGIPSSPPGIMRRLGRFGKRRTNKDTAHDSPQVVAPSQDAFGVAIGNDGR